MLKIDYCMSLVELQEYSDEEVYQVLKCAKQDKNEFFRAECTYWMCKMEIDRRHDDKCPEYLDVKCISNIFDESHEIIFRLGKHYRLYEIEKGILIYCDKLVPYVFNVDENDSRCVWKYFGIWKEN